MPSIHTPIPSTIIVFNSTYLVMNHNRNIIMSSKKNYYFIWI